MNHEYDNLLDEITVKSVYPRYDDELYEPY